MAALWCSAVQCSAVQCSAVQCSAVQCIAVQCISIENSAVQSGAVLGNFGKIGNTLKGTSSLKITSKSIDYVKFCRNRIRGNYGDYSFSSSEKISADRTH